MPRRGESHKIDDQAVSAVAKVVAGAGAPAEVVHKDYGEDLLVQVTLDERVQPARLWLQVKGTSDAEKMKRGDGSHAVQVRVDHLLRWARSADPVVLVLWDVTKDEGWWFWLSGAVNEFALYVEGQQNKTLRVPADHQLDGDAVLRLSWRSVIVRYGDAILRAESAEAFHRGLMEDAAETDSGWAAELGEGPADGSAVLIFDFFRLLRIIDDNGVSDTARRWFGNACRRLRHEPEFAGDQRKLHMAATTLVLLGAVHARAPDVGLPGYLAELAAYRLLPLLEGSETE